MYEPNKEYTPINQITYLLKQKESLYSTEDTNDTSPLSVISFITPGSLFLNIPCPYPPLGKKNNKCKPFSIFVKHHSTQSGQYSNISYVIGWRTAETYNFIMVSS